MKLSRKWCAEETLKKAVARAFEVQSIPICDTSVQIENSDELTISNLETALTKAALLIDRYGEEYLDYFVRIQEELEIVEAKGSALEEAKKLAAQSSKTSHQRDFIQP